MKASTFSDAQKAFVLKQGADGLPVADICRRAGISQATSFNWKKKYEGLSYRAEHEIATLEKVCAKVGYPRTIRVDQGSEFISRHLDRWA